MAKSKKKRKSTVSSMKKTADSVFSELVRRSACEDGEFVTCITCGQAFHWKCVDAGHFKGRRYNSTRYDKRNVHCQCRTCNRGEEGRLYEYGCYLIKQYGEGIIDELRELSHEHKSFTILELKELIKGWRSELKRL